MLRRYVAACGAILVLAVVVAAIVYKATPTSYFGTCAIDVSLPPTETKLGSDFFAFNQKLAQDVASATLGTVVFLDVARANNISVEDLTHNTTVGGAGQSVLSIAVSDNDAARATHLANAVCTKLVSAVRDLLAARQKTSASQTAARIAELEQERDAIVAIPAADRTPAQDATLTADVAAITSEQASLAATIGLQPDLVQVAETASVGVASGADFARDLVIAIIAGVLASFLVILVGEVLVERRAGQA